MKLEEVEVLVIFWQTNAWFSKGWNLISMQFTFLSEINEVEQIEL